jgi:hypothetical protein
MFQKVGIVEEWRHQKDQGRFEIRSAEADRMVFKVPTLRNIVETAPYFHDGSVASLDAAVHCNGQASARSDANAGRGSGHHRLARGPHWGITERIHQAAYSAAQHECRTGARIQIDIFMSERLLRYSLPLTLYACWISHLKIR